MAKEWNEVKTAALKVVADFEGRKQCLDAVRQARQSLRVALSAAPQQSNLSDEINSVAESLDEIGNDLHTNNYDAAGMQKGLPTRRGSKTAGMKLRFTLQEIQKLASLTTDEIVASYQRSGANTSPFNIVGLQFDHFYIDSGRNLVAVYTATSVTDEVSTTDLTTSPEGVNFYITQDENGYQGDF